MASDPFRSEMDHNVGAVGNGTAEVAPSTESVVDLDFRGQQ